MNGAQLPVQETPRFPIALLSMLILAANVSFWGLMPVWLNGVSLACAGYALLSGRMLPSAVRLVCVIAGVAAFAVSFKTRFSVDMAASFLFLSVSLKLLELKSQRDLQVLVYVMLYLSAVSFLFGQGIGHTALQVLILVFAFAVLLSINSAREDAFLASFKRNSGVVFKGVAIALPLVAVLFLFFPRIAPLWSIPVKTQEATSGITDRMTPGDISRLGKSDERAFRVDFSNLPPRPQDRYWRGLVLDRFDGKTWSRFGQDAAEIRREKIDRGRLGEASGASYEVMFEPSNQRWAFTLDDSRSLNSHLLSADMGLFRFKTEVIQPTRYRMAIDGKGIQGVPDLPHAAVVNSGRRISTPAFRDLQLPQASNPQTRLFVRQLREQHSAPLDLVTAIMYMFRDLPFYYTLEPPETGSDFVDEFLFSTRSGFCSHYAGSMAFMLRLAGIPARVVVGYQGGEMNAAGNYLLVHQYDAHAWVEARLPEWGWVRLDPTAMVAPERISDSLQAAVGAEAVLGSNTLSAMMRSVSWMNWVRLRLDQLNYQWQKWVVNYNQSNQYDFITRLMGEFSLMYIATILLGAFVVVSMVLVAYFWWFYFNKNLHREEKQYVRMLRVLALLGYHRGVGEAPKAYQLRVAKSLPKLLKKMLDRRTTALYEHVYTQPRHDTNP